MEQAKQIASLTRIIFDNKWNQKKKMILTRVTSPSWPRAKTKILSSPEKKQPI